MPRWYLMPLFSVDTVSICVIDGIASGRTKEEKGMFFIKNFNKSNINASISFQF